MTSVRISLPGMARFLFSICVLGSFLGLSHAASAARTSHVSFESTNLWNAGIGGYETYRIPGIVVTTKGTILAYTSARRSLKLGDWSNIDIVLRRSTDGGRTWSPSRRIAGDSQGVTDNPVAIVDKQTGRIDFLFQRNYAHCYLMHSDDDGLTWSKPTDITYVFDKFRPEYDWNVIAPGVGHAIQLRSGRLLVPIWMAKGKPTGHVNGAGAEIYAHRPSAVATIYSDDHGKTWKRGAVIVVNSPEVPNPSESMTVQLANGDVMINIRNESTRHRRVVSISPNGISHWSTPRFDEALFEPVCAASILRYSLHPDRILFLNPDSESLPGTGKHQFEARENLTLRMSYDEGKTWPVERVVDPGVAGYSDMAVNPDGTIDVLYESGSIRGSDTNNAHVIFARFDLSWLTGR